LLSKDFDLSNLKNPERKRFREKRRRERVNESYENLKSLLFKVDSQRYVNLGGSNDMSQIEIVNSAITVIHQLLDENNVLRRKLLELQSALYHEQNLEQMPSNTIHNSNLEPAKIADQNKETFLNYDLVPT
jgi:Helix-loop-helix DNA-binding domain